MIDHHRVRPTDFTSEHVFGGTAAGKEASYGVH